MKTAILLATRKDDKLAAKVILHGPYSEVLREFKQRVAADRGEPGYDSIVVWTGPPAKKHSRFSSGTLGIVPGEMPEMPTPEELAEAVASWKETYASMQKRILALEAELTEAKTKFHDAAPQGEDKASPIVEGYPSGEGNLSGGNDGPPTTELPTNAQAGIGEGGETAAQANPATGDGGTGELTLDDAPAPQPTADSQPPTEASPGSMSPKKKAGR